MKMTYGSRPHRPIGAFVPLFVLLFFALGCSAVDDEGAFVPIDAGGGFGGQGGSPAEGGFDAGCTEGDFVCEGSVAWRCDATGNRVAPVDCSGEEKICVEGVGCVICAPGSASCAEGIGAYCVEDGSYEEHFSCDPAQGLACNPDGCVGACSPQEIGESHAGCDFWPTVTANSAWGPWFHFGVLVVNTTDEQAALLVTRGDQTIDERPLAPGGVETIELPWIDSLKGPDAALSGKVNPPTQSVLSKSIDGQGAYRLRSTRPVVVTQFNTLRASDPDGLDDGCPPASDGGACLSYSNDASLLLPAHALDSMHVLMGWHAWNAAATDPSNAMPDFVSITAAEDQTSVVIAPSSVVLPIDGEEPIRPGESRSFPLDRGDVLEMFVDPASPGAQWAGTEVSANHPIQVITGAPCVNVPDDVPACDHVEETNLPLRVLGKRYMVMAPQGPRGRVRHVVRVHGIEDDTVVQFDPSSVHKSITVSEGEVVEVDLPSGSEQDAASDVFISSTKRFGLTQYMVGGQSDPIDPKDPMSSLGDPSQTFAVPTSRYLKRYLIALPAGFEEHRLAIVASTGAEVLLDGVAIASEAFQAIGASGLSVARVADLAPSKRYELRSDKPFGVQVYGFGDFTSYMFPGGIDLRPSSQ